MQDLLSNMWFWLIVVAFLIGVIYIWFLQRYTPNIRLKNYNLIWGIRTTGYFGDTSKPREYFNYKGGIVRKSVRRDSNHALRYLMDIFTTKKNMWDYLRAKRYKEILIVVKPKNHETYSWVTLRFYSTYYAAEQKLVIGGFNCYTQDHEKGSIEEMLGLAQNMFARMKIHPERCPISELIIAIKL